MARPLLGVGIIGATAPEGDGARMVMADDIDWTLVLGALAIAGFVVAAVAVWFAVSHRLRHGDAAEAITSARKAAEASDRRLFSILQSIPVALVETDRQGVFVFANPAAHALLGRKDAELLGLRFHSATWGVTFPDGKAIPTDLLPNARALRGQTVRDFQHILANPRTRRKMLVSVTAMPILDAQGRITGSTAALVETTAPVARLPGEPAEAASFESEVAVLRRERDEALAGSEQAQADARAEIASVRRLQDLGRLTGGVAHDFHALLVVMTSALDMMLKQADDPVRVRRLGQAALTVGRRGEVLTTRLAAFSEGENQASQTLDLGILLHAMEGRLRERAGPAVDLMIEAPPTPSLARIDPVAFQGAVEALVTNAVQAVAGGVDGGRSVAVRLEAVVDRLRLTVRDNGPGMDADTLGRATEPFFTTRAGANGLGLARAQAFARQAGGRLTLDSAPGQGCEAALDLPAALLADPAAA